MIEILDKIKASSRKILAYMILAFSTYVLFQQGIQPLWITKNAEPYIAKSYLLEMAHVPIAMAVCLPALLWSVKKIISNK